MSLVILSNTQDEYIRRNNNEFVIASGNGISSPSSFINNFRSPLIVEPDSEVAVESVKINRGPKFDIDSTNLFYIYQGKELINVNACESTKEPVPVRIKKGSYTVSSLSERLETALNRALMGPEVWGKYKVTVNLDTDNNFKNFKINQVSNNTTPSSITWTGSDDEFRPGNPVTAKTNLDWSSPGTYTLDFVDAQYTNDGVIVLPKYPLSSCSGVFEVNFSNATGLWDVGLSRATIANYMCGQPPNAPEHLRIDQNGEPFYDYNVLWDGTSIVVQHGVTDKIGLDIQMVEIPYWQNTGAAPSFALPIDAAKISASGLDSVRFTLYGNGMELSIGTQGGTFYPLVSPINTKLNNTDRRYNFKPTNNATESLYPKMALYTLGDELSVTKYNGLDQTGWIPPTQKEDGNNDGIFTPGSDWYSNQIVDNPRRIRFLDKRDSLQTYSASLTDYSYNLINASSSPDYNFVIIAGPERDLTSRGEPVAYTETYLIGFGEGREPNMNNVLGFGKLSVLEQSIYGNGAGISSVIITPPSQSLFKTHDAFIRVNNLTGVSYNGVKGSISKILYHIPRFDNSGNKEGNLYFAPGEKTFIELGNTERMILNQLDVDVVDRSERLVDDLIGSTVVVLYIRKVKR